LVTIAEATGLNIAAPIATHKNTKNTAVYVKVNNLTDKYYQTTYGYATAPRAYYAGIKVKF